MISQQHSIRLSDFDYQEDALLAIQGAFRLQRHLAADRPATFNPASGLASSLDILSICLSKLGHRREAEQISKEAAELAGRVCGW